MPASVELVVRRSETLTIRPGRRCSTSTRWAPMRVSEAFVDHVARSERKLIVTLTSGMGSLADNTSGGSIAYRSSKAAVNMVMRSLAIDLAPHGITIWITAQAATRLRNMSNLLKGCSARLQPRVIIVPHRIVGKFNGRLVSQSACLMDGLDYFCSHFSHRRRSVTGGRS